MIKNPLLLLLVFFFLLQLNAQDREIKEKPADSLDAEISGKGFSIEDIEKRENINPLAPSKAAFYSAILPGLGQVYNRRYWKVPIVLGAIGTGVYVYIFNDNEYDRFRSAFKRRRAGFTDDEFYDINNSGIVPGEPDLSDQALQDAQERFQRDRDLALLITIGLYALNIIDANVDAHLKQFNVDDNLGMEIKPYLEYNPVTADPNYGLALTVKF